VRGNSCRIRSSRSRRDQDTFGLDLILDLVHRHLVVADDEHLGTELAQILHEVIGERVVIIDYKQHFSDLIRTAK